MHEALRAVQKPGGGENHPDAIVAEQSIWIDGTKIVESGAIVAPPSLVTLAERLLPAR